MKDGPSPPSAPELEALAYLKSEIKKLDALLSAGNNSAVLAGIRVLSLTVGLPDRLIAPAPAHGPSLPSGWRVQRNEDGSIGLFAPPPVDGESRRTSELFTGKLGSDMNEIVFKLLTHMLDATQAPAPAPEVPAGMVLVKAYKECGKDADDNPGLRADCAEKLGRGQPCERCPTRRAKPDRTGMIYYRRNDCTATSADSPDCICWSPNAQ